LLGREYDGQIIVGALERAADGTLVIDELSDLCDTAQRLLVGLIEDGEFTRKNGSTPVNDVTS